MIQYLHITLEIWAAVFCVVAAFVIYPARSFDRGSAHSCIALLLTDCVLNIADVLAWFLHGGSGAAAGYLEQIASFSVMALAFLMLILMAWHQCMVITTRNGTVDRRLPNLTVLFSVLGILVLIVSRFLGPGKIYSIDDQNVFTAGDGFWIPPLVAELALLPLLIQTLKNRHALRKRDFRVFIYMYALMAAGGVLQILLPGVNLINAAFAVSLILLILAHQYEYTADMIKRERRRASEQINLYTRQIQPHFIYNSLSAIRSDLPEGSKARESLNHFAGFLRGSIDLLCAESCIPAEREFATVMDYLYMEKERFGEDITVVTDIRDRDFLLPAFTVQTLVENAINHGIRETEDGRGKLKIRSLMTQKAHRIEIEDDGVGFVFDEILDGGDESEDGRSHIGILNVRKRLALMCNGSLTIKSEPQKGCLVIVEIPRE